MSKHTKGPWRYEGYTKTIRAVPQNYWLASMNSFEGAVDHEANARLMATAPEQHELLKLALQYLEHPDVQAIPFALPVSGVAERVRAVIAKAKSPPNEVE